MLPPGWVQTTPIMSMPAAVIDPAADRDALWNEIVARIEAGDFDTEIEEVSQRIIRNLREAQQRRGRKAA